jgi:hypothetical protein
MTYYTNSFLDKEKHQKQAFWVLIGAANGI